MISQCLRLFGGLTALLLTAAQATQVVNAQHPLSPPAPEKLPVSTETIDPTEIQRQRFLHSVAQAVVSLDANGDRTMDAIENSQITLTLDTFQDSSRLAVLCNSGGNALNVFTQTLAKELSLSGKANEAVCGGAGRDDDPFIVKFRLHYESGGTSLFYENPPELSLSIEKPIEDDLEGNTMVDRAEFSQRFRDLQHDEPAEPSPKPVLLNPRRTQSSHAVVQLPQGWTPVKLPDPKHADSAFGTFDSSVSFADGKLTVDRKLLLKRDKVEVAELPTFQKWTEAVEGGVNVALRSTLYYPYRDASGGTEAQKKAANLINEAYNEIHAHNLAKAEAALNEAEAIDPGHEILHENRGELAEARGDNVTALAEYRKELELFPDALYEMSSIAEAQRKLHDLDGSIVTLQRWMLADPNSSFAATTLMERYHAMGRDDLAVRVGDDAMNIMTKDAKRGVDFLLEYGHEQMLTGQSPQSKRTFEALLDLTVDDHIVNDAAYYLSEQGLSLDRTEQSVREALTEFDPDSPARALSTWYADSSPERTSLLLSTWDTLGWILYKKGAVQEAESYVRAAWRSKQDLAIGRHLGEILTAEDRPIDAMDIYTIALATIADEKSQSIAKDSDLTAIQNALAQLKEKGNTPSITDPRAALLALRTLELGPATKPHGPRPHTVNITSSELAIYASGREGDEEPQVHSDEKVLAEFFPPGSKAALNLKANIQCTKTCSLVFTR